MKRIQIIEDDAAIRAELKTLLWANGYLPVEEEPCDLVLMDVNLPGESGFTLCRKLRQISDTPVIFLTARDTPDAEAMRKELSWITETQEGPEEKCSFAIQELHRIYNNANAGTLIIGTLYISTVFVCMALAILSVKTLSTLEDERKRFAVLYRLGADTGMQKSALLRQTGAFFLMPFAFPLLMTVPIGVIFGKIYKIWGFAGLNGQRAMETAVLIMLVIAGIYALYFVITYRTACSHVLCCGSEKQESSAIDLC